VVRDAAGVRSRIGLAGQYAAVDETLSGRENLELVGRLYGLSHQTARARAGEVLERLTLDQAADRLVRTYSGGMRRRLDLGASLVGRPLVLIMDEPTTGLDPRTRIELWRFIEELVGEGTTLLLTTQYLEEADRLADRIAVIDRGRVIADGTADELKARVGGERVEVRLAEAGDTFAAMAALEPMAPQADGAVVRVRGAAIMDAALRLHHAGIEVEDLAVRRPTLDDVFLSLTGHAAEDPMEVAA
jgi:ABC-type multidrug transport system ATPase subunit